jgi:FkbM family methyltransferase
MNTAEFIYSVLLKPRPLRSAANFVLRSSLPEKVVRHGATIVLNPADPVVSGALRLGTYEKAETAFFLSHCRPGMTFLDIGANYGYYTALFLTRSGPGSRVIALEPDLQNFEFLQRTVVANKGENVTCLPLAASDKAGRATLYRNLENRGDNRLYPNDLASSACEVETNTIDSILRRLSVDQVNLIKMDVQGFEGRVLEGMKNTLGAASRFTQMKEFWPYGLRQSGTDPANFLRALEETGFTLFDVTGRGCLRPVGPHDRLIELHPGPRYTNLVAIKGEDALRSCGGACLS